MIWNSWSEFAAMGGYGLYVWGSFGVTAVVMAGEMLAVAARRRALRHDGDAGVDEEFAESLQEPQK
jgi:heme exporter protein D